MEGHRKGMTEVKVMRRFWVVTPVCQHTRQSPVKKESPVPWKERTFAMGNPPGINNNVALTTIRSLTTQLLLRPFFGPCRPRAHFITCTNISARKCITYSLLVDAPIKLGHFFPNSMFDLISEGKCYVFILYVYFCSFFCHGYYAFFF